MKGRPTLAILGAASFIVGSNACKRVLHIVTGNDQSSCVLAQMARSLRFCARLLVKEFALISKSAGIKMVAGVACNGCMVHAWTGIQEHRQNPGRHGEGATACCPSCSELCYSCCSRCLSRSRDSQPALVCSPWLVTAGGGANNRQRGDSNPCGQSPVDFESISLAARTHCQ